jgi:hypothetical protein
VAEPAGLEAHGVDLVRRVFVRRVIQRRHVSLFQSQQQQRQAAQQQGSRGDRFLFLSHCRVFVTRLFIIPLKHLGYGYPTFEAFRYLSEPRNERVNYSPATVRLRPPKLRKTFGRHDRVLTVSPM